MLSLRFRRVSFGDAGRFDFGRYARLAFALVLCVFLRSPILAQDVGMGERVGDQSRFEVPYGSSVSTPHVRWYEELPGGPLRVLTVPSVQEGRTLVELAQRMPLELTTVTIDPAWDRNKWTMAFGENYGARAERGDLKLVYSYLEEELVSSKPFDVILLPLHHGWEALTEASITALTRRIQQGCGLVLIRPFDHPLSPLRLAEPSAGSGELYREREPARESSAWKTVGRHFITRAIPVESFPFHLLENYRYRPAEGCQVLIESETGAPILAAGRIGQGRVVAFGYRNYGMSWRMDWAAKNEPVGSYWEYFYGLLCRSLLFASGRELPMEPDLSSASSQWRVRAEGGAVMHQGRGIPVDLPDLPAGRFFLEQQSPADWNISVLERPHADQIEKIAVSPKIIVEGTEVTVEFLSTAQAKVELVDGFGRVVGRSETVPGDGPKKTSLIAARPLTHSGQIRILCGSFERRVEVLFASSQRQWEDYEIILPWYGPDSYQPWIPALDEQFRRIGITTLADPLRNFKIIASIHDPVFGIYWYRRARYEERKKEFLRTGDKRFLARDISLHAPDLEDRMREQFQRRAGDLVPLSPFAYYLADESSVTCYADAFDVDWSAEDLTAFRDWLRERYAGVAAVNQSWDTRFANWDEVVPMTTSEAQAHGNFAPWAEHRAFMEEAFIQAIEKAGRVARGFDPEARVSFSGTQIPTPHNGCNWYEIDQIADYLQPYSGGNQDAMHYLFRPGIRLTGFTGYGLIGDEVQFQVWRRLFYGHSGASIFWHYTLLNPDLSLSPQGEALAQAFGRMQGGIGRVFMNSTVHEDGVAIHFSMDSIRGAWITDGKIVDRVVSAQRTSENFAELMKRRNDWVEELERRGVQFRFLATPQIEEGALSDFRVLVLPYSIAISDREREEIERFAARGGQVLVDEQVGRMDEKNRWRPEPLWKDLPLGFAKKGPGDVGIPHPLGFADPGLATVRRFGDFDLYGFIPEKAAELELPPTSRVRYDLLRGGIAGKIVAASPAEPLLVLERDSPIALLEVDRGLNIFLKDEMARPIERSVISIQVFAPDGSLIRPYSGNVTIVEGQGSFEIPFALNDTSGAWRVRARDVVSGLVAEVVIDR